MTQTTFDALVNTLKELQAEEKRLKTLIEAQQFEKKFGHLKDTITVNELVSMTVKDFKLLVKIAKKRTVK